MNVVAAVLLPVGHYSYLMASPMRMAGGTVLSTTAVHDEVPRATLCVGMKSDMFAAPGPGSCAWLDLKGC